MLQFGAGVKNQMNPSGLLQFDLIFSFRQIFICPLKGQAGRNLN